MPQTFGGKGVPPLIDKPGTPHKQLGKQSGMRWGAININGGYCGKTLELAKAATKIRLDVLAVSDIRVRGEKEEEVGEYKVYLSGVKAGRAQWGVGLHIKKATEPRIVTIRNGSLPMTRISTRKSIEIQPNNKHCDTETKIKVIDRRKQTLKTILRDEAPVFLSHEEVVVSDNLKKGRRLSKNRQKIEDLSGPPLRGGLTEKKTRCIQVTEEVGKALRTSAWQNRKEDIGSISVRSRQPANCDRDMTSVNSAVTRKRVSLNIPPYKESPPTMFNKVRENRKASRCCAECKAVVFDREKLRLRAALGVKICDTCWSKKKPKEVHVATRPARAALPRASSPTVKNCLVKLFDVSRYPAGHPFGKGFLSQRSLKRKFNESRGVDDTASEMVVQPKRARRSAGSPLPAEIVNTSKVDQLKDSKDIFHVSSGHSNETGAKERTRAAPSSRNVSRVTTDVITSNKNEKTNRRKSEQSAAENSGQETLQEKVSHSQLKVNAQSSPERRISRRNNASSETKANTRTSTRSSINNESASGKRTLRKSSLNAEVSPEKGTTQKDRENVESPTGKKPEKNSMNAEISSERKSRRSSMNAEIASQKKTPQRGRTNVESTPENMVSRRSSVNADISGGKKTSRSSTSTDTTPARVSRRNSVNTETTSEMRLLRRNSSSNETSGTAAKRRTSISNNASKSARPVRIQSKSLPTVLRKGKKQVISSVRSKTAAAKLETKSDKNTSKIRLTQIKSLKLRKVLPEAAVAKNSLINNKKKQLIVQQNKLKTAIPVISRKGSVLPKYSKQAEKPLAKRVIIRKTDSDLKNRKILSRGGSNKKSVFGKVHSKITPVEHVKKRSINTLDTSSEKTAASRKRKMDVSDKSPGVKKRKIENVPARRKQTVVEKELPRANNLTYSCDICNKKYSSLAEERLHELSHSGRQPILVLHKCDSPLGVLSLIREDDFSSLNICSSDSEIQKDLACELNTRCDGSNTEVNTEADIGTVDSKDEDTDAIQLAVLENTDEQTESSVNKSFEVVETEEVCDIDHEKSAPFDNSNIISVSDSQEIQYSQQRIHSDTEVDKDKTDTILENPRESKAEVETPKETSTICSSETTKKPKTSDEINVLLEEIFGESSEEDLISVTGIKNLRQTADAVNSGIDKISESSTEKPTCAVNSLQHTSVNKHLGAVVPVCSSATADAVTEYLRGDTHNPEEILHQLNYGDKTDTEDECKADKKSSSDTDQADTSVKVSSHVELINSHKDGDSEGDSHRIPCVTNIEGQVSTFKDSGDGNRLQLIVDDESEVLDSQQPQSVIETESVITAKEDTLEPSTDIIDNGNMNVKDSADITVVGEDNVLKHQTSDENSMKVDISLEVNKDFPGAVQEDNSVMLSVNGGIISESSCKQPQNELVNQNVGHPYAHCIDNTEMSSEQKYKADNGDTHISVVAESINQKQQQTGDPEKQVLLDTTNNSAIHEILVTCGNNDKFEESELPSEICHDKKTVECNEKDQSKSHMHIQAEDSTKNIPVVDLVSSDSEIKDKKIVQQVKYVDNSDVLNKQNSCEINIVCDASEACHKDTSICFQPSSQPENSTHTLREGTPQTDRVHGGNNENEVSSKKHALEDALQNEICEDNVGISGNGLIEDVLLVENSEANEILDSASTDIVSVTEIDGRSIAVHSPSEGTTIDSMDVDSGKNITDTVPKPDESEDKDVELDLLAEPDTVCDASQKINSSHQANTQANTCDVSSLKSDSKMVVSGEGHNVECEDISTTLDNDPEIDNVEQEIERPEFAHTVEAVNASHEEEKGNVLQRETLDPEPEVPVLNSNDDLNVQFADQKLQTCNDSHEMQATNDSNIKDDGVDSRPCTYPDDNNLNNSHELTGQDPNKEVTQVDVVKTCQSVESTNVVATKDELHCQMEPLSADYGVDTSEKSEEIEVESTAQEIETTGSNCDTQTVDSICDDSKIETRGLNFEVEVKEPREGAENANANHEDEFVNASEEVVVALDASSERDALVSSDEVGADVQFVPSSDLNNTHSEITAGISDSIPSIVGVENLSFNVHHNVPDVFEEEEQILQEVEDRSILQEPDCAVESLTKEQNEIQEAETEDSVKPPLVSGLNGINEKVVDECSTKTSGNGDLKDSLHLAVSGDNDISGLEPISDDELDFM